MSNHQRIRLIHWNDAERAERAHQLRKAGYTVDADWTGLRFARRKSG